MSIKRFAEILKELENTPWMGVLTGEVVGAPPELKVKIHEKIVLEKHQIVVSWEKVKGYNRAYSLEGTLDNIEQDMTVDSSNMSLAGSGPHKHNLLAWGGTGSGTYTAHGTITWKDELVVGDKVILIPALNEKKFYLVDKVYMYK